MVDYNVCSNLMMWGWWESEKSCGDFDGRKIDGGEKMLQEKISLGINVARKNGCQ